MDSILTCAEGMFHIARELIYLESQAEFLEKSKISFMISKICRFLWWVVIELSFTSKNLILAPLMVLTGFVIKSPAMTHLDYWKIIEP